MAVKKRCGFCLKHLRPKDNTCANPKCPRYVPDKPKEESTQETPSDDTTTPSTGGNA